MLPKLTILKCVNLLKGACVKATTASSICSYSMQHTFMSSLSGPRLSALTGQTEQFDKEDDMSTNPTDHTGEDLPMEGMKNPFEKPSRKCILCEQDVELDYKNVRLLSQFVSPHTGRVYGREITGLCLYMQRRVENLINISRVAGFMPYVHKDPRFLRDPKLYDPFRKAK